MTDVRILVAAPDPGLAADAVRCLSRLGYAAVGPVSSGQQAVRLAAESRPDLALLDMALPGPVDGPAAAARIRRQLGLAVVLLVPAAAALEPALAAEPDGLAFPPLKPARLRAAIELALLRHRAEDTLRRGAGRLAATLDGMADAVLAADAHGRVTYLNAAAELLTGRTREDARGRLAAEILSLRDEPTGQPIADPVCWALGEGRAPGAALLQIRDGETVPVGVTVGRVAGEAGEPDGAVLVVRDVRADRRREEHARFLDKMQAVGQLAGGLAHQFNNLLTLVNGYSDLLAGALSPSHPWGPFVEEIRQAGERAAELTQQLLTFSRGQMVRPRRLDVQQVVIGAVPALRRLLGERIELLTDLGPDVPSVRADPGQLEEVLRALAANAREAMPEGGRCTLQTAAVVLSEAEARARPGLRPGRWALLRVHDTGCGTPPDVRARAFEPFFSTRAASQSLGLGLAAVYAAVRQGGGHVELASEAGRGTAVSIYLPAADEGEPPVLQMPGLPRGTETVLLAEDEGMVRDLNRQVLQMCGYTVLEARDGEEALAVSAAHPGRIDLLVTDVRMPRVGGPELARSLAAQRPGVKVVFLSGAVDVYAAGLPPDTPFLAKPYSVNDLARTVRDALDAGAG